MNEEEYLFSDGDVVRFSRILANGKKYTYVAIYIAATRSWYTSSTDLNGRRDSAKAIMDAEDMLDIITDSDTVDFYLVNGWRKIK